MSEHVATVKTSWKDGANSYLTSSWWPPKSQIFPVAFGWNRNGHAEHAQRAEGQPGQL